jgi:hypothetical protein
MNHFQVSPLIGWAALGLFLLCAFGSCQRTVDEPLPDTYKQSGTFIKSLPYYNPDSCVLLIRRNVPPHWQGAAYENLFLAGPEDSPLQLGFQHLDYYEKNFPADTAREFALLWRGRLYTHLGKFDSAQTCLQASYESSIRHKRFVRAGDAQEGLAGIYYKQGNTAQAIRAFLAVYDAVKNLDTTQFNRKITAIANIASAYSQSDDQQEALIWAKRQIPLTADETTPELRVHKVDTYKQLAVIYERLNLPDSAIFMAQKALELQEKYKTINDLPELLIVLGASYLAKGACPMALQYIQQAIRTRRGNNPTQHLIQIGALADAYLCLGRLDSAELLYKALVLAPDPSGQSHAFTKLSDIYARQGQHKAAYDAIQSSLKIRQKLFDDKQIQAIAVAKSELKLEQTQHQLAQSEQKHQNERLQKLVVVLLLSFALATAMALFFRQRNRRRILEQENQLLEQDKKLLAQEKELSQTRARLSEQALQASQVTLKNTQDELDITTQLLALKSQLIEELELRFTQEHIAPNEEMPPGAAENNKIVQIKILNEKDWMRFRERFEQYIPGLYQNLKDRYPSLTSAEIRLFMLIKLNFDTLEISEALGISKESVWRSRHRLSQKLGLEETKDLDGFVVGFLIQ